MHVKQYCVAAVDVLVGGHSCTVQLGSVWPVVGFQLAGDSGLLPEVVHPAGASAVQEDRGVMVVHPLSVDTWQGGTCLDGIEGRQCT